MRASEISASPSAQGHPSITPSWMPKPAACHGLGRADPSVRKQGHHIQNCASIDPRKAPRGRHRRFLHITLQALTPGPGAGRSPVIRNNDSSWPPIRLVAATIIRAPWHGIARLWCSEPMVGNQAFRSAMAANSAPPVDRNQGHRRGQRKLRCTLSDLPIRTAGRLRTGQSRQS